MKKLLLIIGITLALSSCKKDSGQCYYCTFGYNNGHQPPPVTYCGPDGAYHQFTDAQGNNISSSCTPK